MSSILALLNPINVETDRIITRGPASRKRSASTTEENKSPKKTKIPKDGATYIKRATVGEVRYWPFDDLDHDILRVMEEFNIRKLSEIRDCPRRVPYSSEKTKFRSRTGREAFELFGYTFDYHNTEGKPHNVIWDYNTGLTRITPFFKSCGYQKTVPGKFIKSSGDLQTICQNVTGGSIYAQGYWMPYEAAKALAKTFCYEVRYALVPLFGPDFPRQCLHPQEEGYKDMKVPENILASCVLDAENMLSTQSTSSKYSSVSAPMTPPKPLNDFEKLHWHHDQNGRSPSIRQNTQTGKAKLRQQHSSRNIRQDPILLLTPEAELSSGSSSSIASPKSDIFNSFPRINAPNHMNNIITPQQSPKHKRYMSGLSVVHDTANGQIEDVDERVYASYPLDVLQAAVALLEMSGATPTAQVLEHIERREMEEESGSGKEGEGDVVVTASGSRHGMRTRGPSMRN